MDIRLEELHLVIHSCFILHNFCESKDEPINQYRVAVARKYGTEFQQSLNKSQEVGQVGNIYKQEISYNYI